MRTRAVLILLFVLLTLSACRSNEQLPGTGEAETVIVDASFLREDPRGIICLNSRGQEILFCPVDGYAYRTDDFEAGEGITAICEKREAQKDQEYPIYSVLRLTRKNGKRVAALIEPETIRGTFAGIATLGFVQWSGMKIVDLREAGPEEIDRLTKDSALYHPGATDYNAYDSCALLMIRTEEGEKTFWCVENLLRLDGTADEHCSLLADLKVGEEVELLVNRSGCYVQGEWIPLVTRIQAMGVLR